MLFSVLVSHPVGLMEAYIWFTYKSVVAAGSRHIATVSLHFVKYLHYIKHSSDMKSMSQGDATYILYVSFFQTVSHYEQIVKDLV